MSYETISLLLSWVQLGVLLAIFVRLGRTFVLIANTQRELRRAIYRLGGNRVASTNFHSPPVSEHLGGTFGAAHFVRPTP